MQDRTSLVYAGGVWARTSSATAVDPPGGTVAAVSVQWGCQPLIMMASTADKGLQSQSSEVAGLAQPGLCPLGRRRGPVALLRQDGASTQSVSQAAWCRNGPCSRGSGWKLEMALAEEQLVQLVQMAQMMQIRCAVCGSHRPATESPSRYASRAKCRVARARASPALPFDAFNDMS